MQWVSSGVGTSLYSPSVGSGVEHQYSTSSHAADHRTETERIASAGHSAITELHHWPQQTVQPDSRDEIFSANMNPAKSLLSPSAGSDVENQHHATSYTANRPAQTESTASGSHSAITKLKATLSRSRLFCEEVGVEGTCWFAKHCEDDWHIFANCLRIFILLVIAPIYVLIPHGVNKTAYQYLINTPWNHETVVPVDAILSHPPGEIQDATDELIPRVEYEPTGYKPQRLLKVSIKQTGGEPEVTWCQVAYSGQAYTALSYTSASVRKLYDAVHPSPSGDPRRRSAAGFFLKEYCRALSEHRAEAELELFVFFDDLCFFSKEKLMLYATAVGDDKKRLKEEIGEEKNRELGRLADIYRAAKIVCVFCGEECDHTTSKCVWIHRIWTLPEILHASKVQIMKKKSNGRCTLESKSGNAFRSDMQHNAAREGYWHLHAILQSRNYSGSVPWQTAIHSLIVEAIKRDDHSTSKEEIHKEVVIAKSLNGLLPRRAKLQDLKGRWDDLAWLLELNQGFYNVAALAAVCSLGTKKGWLGPPIDPRVGNERLEPLATAFPVARIGQGGQVVERPLTILGAETIRVHSKLKRDAWALYHDSEMPGTLRWCRWGLGGTFVLGVVATGATGITGHTTAWPVGLVIFLLGSIVFVMVELVVGTMFLEKNEWVYLEEREHPIERLAKLDVDWAKKGLVEWGHRQLIPRWNVPPQDVRKTTQGWLIDMNTANFTKITVTSKPNAAVVLAIHGIGVTCMLLRRHETDAFAVAEKVGMCNLPAYVLRIAVKAGSVSVAGY